MAKQVKVKTVSNLSNNAFLGLMFIVLGIFVMLEGDSLMRTLFTILGAILIVLGAVELFDTNWLIGIIEIVLGVVLIICGNLIAEWVLLILGIAILCYGIYLIVAFFLKNKKPGASRIIVALIAPLLMIVIGILLIVIKFVGGAGVLFYVVGAIAIAVGAFLVFYDLVRKAIRNARKSN